MIIQPPGRPTFVHTADITTCQILDFQSTTGTDSQARHQGSRIFAGHLVRCQAHAYYVGNCLYALLAAKATESDPSRRPVRKSNPEREIVGRRNQTLAETKCGKEAAMQVSPLARTRIWRVCSRSSWTLHRGSGANQSQLLNRSVGHLRRQGCC